MPLRLRILFLGIILIQAGCARIIHLGRSGGKQTGDTSAKETAKSTDSYLNKIDQWELKIKKLHDRLLSKREAGYNTSFAEATIVLLKEGVETAKALILERKFDELEKKLEELEALFRKASDETKRAPEFGERPIKKERRERKYLDDRDWVKELRGDPDQKNKSYRYPTPVRLYIADATAALEQCRCWDSQRNQFILDNPPAMESWYYPADQKIYIFAEDNVVFQQFVMRNELSPSQRDAMLVELCDKQVNSGGLKLIYVGPPLADLSSIMEQILVGRMRFAGMFGLEGMARNMRATVTLPDLAVASIAFNTALHELNQLQSSQLQKIADLIGEIDPEVMASLVAIKNEEDFQKIYNSAASSGKPLQFLEEIRAIRSQSGSPEEKRSRISALIDKQGRDFKKRQGALRKILQWQQVLKTSDKDIKELVSLYPQKADELNKRVRLFKESIAKLTIEFDKLRKDLLKFRTQWSELLFDQKDHVSMFILSEGVRFAEKTFPDGRTVEEPDLSVKIIVKTMLGKKEPSRLLDEKDIKVTSANRYIDETKEYRRLTSFGIVFPFRLAPGRYEVTLLITDNLRVQTVQQEIVWQVIAHE